MTGQHSIYDDPDAIAKGIDREEHRELIGGFWNEIGTLQFEFLKSEGLMPSHRLLDIGCGSLRLGVQMAAYLDPGNYWGTDLNEALLTAGYEREIQPTGLSPRLPRGNLVTDGEFLFPDLPNDFDFAIAQSVFTHLPLNHLRLCLTNLAAHLPGPCLFYATFFLVPEEHAHGAVTHHPGGVISHPHKDPFHHTLADLRHAAAGLPWDIEPIGDWKHPRNQQMVRFRKSESSSTRQLSVAEAGTLPPGGDHYRAYVGPPERYDFIGASQFNLLFQLGLRDTHTVLDFGCGSLRLGRLLIPFLRAGNYAGLDPNAWLIEEGIRRELGHSAVDLKRPEFRYNDDFDSRSFGRKFDFVIAQSIVTHTGPDQVRAMFAPMREAMAEDGLFLFSYIRHDESLASEWPPEGWHYPGCVGYTDSQLIAELASAGLTGIPVGWYHPGASWMIAAANLARLPDEDRLKGLAGIVIPPRG